jgi:asparagine synthase (glutamine-hydrolysing)
MSMFIGYWSAGRESPERLRRLLDGALGAAGCGQSQILSRHHEPHASRLDDSAHRRPFSFGLGACGRQAKLETVEARGPGGAPLLTAALTVSGTGAVADAWARAGEDGLVLGREAFGRATLFWTRMGEAVWFASRLGLLLSVAGRAEVSLAGFYAYGCYSYVPAPLSPVHGIFAVPAGTEAAWDGAQPEAAPRTRALQEWREGEEQETDESAALVRLRRLLDESVAEQLSDERRGPVGVFLSGGLDSALTAALLARAGMEVRAYTLDFGAGCFSEAPYAEQVARSLGIPLTKVAVTPRRVRRTLAPVAARLDGLYGDGVTVPLDLLCERAAREVRVVFNGEGGDQLFAGWTNKPIIAASLYEQSAAPEGRDEDDAKEAFAAHYLRTFHRLHGHEAGVYTDEARREIDRLDARAPLAAALDSSSTRGLLHRLRRANLMLKGADNIQPRASNLGLSHGLDVRTLFCSRPLAEWTFGTSGELWLRGGCEKYLLKRAAEDLLPAEVVWREKRGMGVPLAQWLAGPLRRWALRQLGPRTLEAEGLWLPDIARRVMEGRLGGHVQGRRVGETLWLMLTWRAWRDRVLGEAGERAREGALAQGRRPALRLMALRALRRRYT